MSLQATEILHDQEPNKDKSGDVVHKITATQQIIASTVGALATSLIVTPLDVVKIRLQAQQRASKNCFIYSNGLMEHLCYCINGDSHAHVHASDGSTIPIDKKRVRWYNRPMPTGHLNGTFDALIKISRSEGILSLWSGLPPTLLMAIPATVVYFTVYDRLRVSLWTWHGSTTQPLWIPMFCGAAARCIAATVISPLEMIRTKMQSTKLSYHEVGLALKQLVRHEGISSLWRGLGPTFIRDVPFSSIYWATYEQLKQSFNQQSTTLQFSLSAGAFAGSLAAISTHPFDLVKTHRQIELGEMDILRESKLGRRTNSTMHILQTIYRRNGIAGCFSGIVPRVIKVAPSCAIMISCYEIGKQFFVAYNQEKSSV